VVDTIKKKRRLTIRPTRVDSSGQIAHDHRGDPIWQWSKDDPLRRGLDGSGLSLADEQPPPAANVKLGSPVKSYNPYESGLLDKSKEPPRKRDLRELSKWITKRKQQGPDPTR
jgi:hypothetical protein